MPPIIDVNTEESQKKLSLFKRYKDEVIQVAFAAVIAYLFMGQKALERDWRLYIITDGKAAYEKMNVTTTVIEKNTGVMEKVKDVLIENSEALRRIERENQERNLKR